MSSIRNTEPFCPVCGLAFHALGCSAEKCARGSVPLYQQGADPPVATLTATDDLVDAFKHGSDAELLARTTTALTEAPAPDELDAESSRVVFSELQRSPSPSPDLVRLFGDPHPLRVLTEAAPEMAAMLREVEWNGSDVDDICPFCAGDKKRGGHQPDCMLRALLDRIDAAAKAAR